MHRKPNAKTKWERVSFIKVGFEPLSARLKHVDISFTDKESRKDAIARAAQSVASKMTPVHVDTSAEEVFVEKFSGTYSKVATYSTVPIAEPQPEEELADLFSAEQEDAAA